MIKIKQLTLRAKLILAFSLIASFTLISSGTAVYLFQIYQGQLLSMSKSQGQPLVTSAEIIEQLQELSLQLERIKSADTLNQGLLALDEIKHQWSGLLLNLDKVQELNPSISAFYDYKPDTINQLLVAIPTVSKIISALFQNQKENESIHIFVLKQQQQVLASYNNEISFHRQILERTMDADNSQRLNLLTDIERKINKVTRILFEALSSKKNERLSLLAHKSLTTTREIELLSKQIDQDIQATTQTWLDQTKPYVASSHSIFQQSKRQIRLKKILNSHIDLHINTINQLDKSVHQSVKHLKNEIIIHSTKLTQDVALASKLLIALVIVCLASVCLIIWLFVSRHIIRPFIETSKSMQRLAEGEVQIAIPSSGDSEVQKMLHSLKVLQQYVAKVNDMAEKDSLTDIFNRRHFDKTLNCALENVQADTNISLLMCDLDHFKPYNDYYGHQQGDDCLKFFAQILQRLSDNVSDHVCRYGGEEFAIIIINKPAHYAETLAQLICNETSKALIPHKKSECAEIVTVSVGVTTMLLEEVSDINHLISQADQALYQAKNNGRNCVLVH